MGKQKGFSLLELIIVLLVISLATAAIFPRISGSLARAKRNSTVRQVAAMLRQARNMAAVQKRIVSVVCDLSEQTLAYALFTTIIDKNKTETEEDGGLIHTYRFPDGIRLDRCFVNDSRATSGEEDIYFFEDGSSTGGQVVLRDNRQRSMILEIEDFTGSVSIKTPSSQEQ